LPYICGKALIEQTGLRVAFARRFVFLLFVVALISVYEFRMGDNPYLPVFERFFPGQDPAWFTQMRWGLGRIAGPYGHAILMGCILSTALILCVWLSRCRLWERNFKVLGQVYFTKQQILIGMLLFGMAMTLSRGPWLGGLCGLILAAAGVGPNWRRAFKRNLLAVILIGIGIYVGGRIYLSTLPQPGEFSTAGMSSAEASEVEQSTAYRAVLFDKYVDIVMQRPVLGWGRANWPQVHGMSSIDNNYLFVALNTGIVGVGLFFMLFVVICSRLVWSAFSADQHEPAERLFCFSLLGIIVSIGVTTASVFMGSQLYPIFFLFLGWSEACTVQQLERVEARRIELASEAAIEMTGVVV
jgi:O-antigen ligase